MRIFTDCFEMIREVERDLWEMGIEVHPQTMQDKHVADNPDYKTKEIRAYGFTITPPQDKSAEMVEYLWPQSSVLEYCQTEFVDRVSTPSNPGKSYLTRNQVWSEFLHDGKFAYTYSERIHPQLVRITEELRTRPDTRQAIIEIHSNLSHDLHNVGGRARIPCSMYYQFLRREGKLDMIYTMRSCDFLTHFPVDIWLALMLQAWVAGDLSMDVGNFTYFTGSLHAYYKDLKARGIF